MKILIRNLDRKTTEEQVAELFLAHGRVSACALVMDKETGASKGFGFVEMPEEDSGAAAIKALNGSVVAGSKIRVKVSSKLYWE